MTLYRTSRSIEVGCLVNIDRTANLDRAQLEAALEYQASAEARHLRLERYPRAQDLLCIA
jgi:hypothetical protein